MSLGRTRSVALEGLEGAMVEVEVHVGSGLPAFTVGGLPDTACAQAPERVKAATGSAGHPVPPRRITVNLSPASLPKRGSQFDLGIAVALLAAQDVVPVSATRDVVHLGELGLDGSIRGVPGVLPAVLASVRAGIADVVVPLANAREATLVEGARVHAVADLAELVAGYRSSGRPVPLTDTDPASDSGADAAHGPDLAEVIGQHEARVALELAAVGGHHVFFSGPPGAGKTMLAERLVTILPPLGPAQALDVLAVRSVLGITSADVSLDRVPPFVAPHHSASSAAVIGGGVGVIRPGAVTRADHGVLFLDEAPEFRNDVLQSLRQPLESGRVVIARARSTVCFPARFQLVLAANPCPCGHGYGKGVDCSCTPRERRAYAGKLSGPLLDRVDLQVHLPPVHRAAMAGPPGESSADVATRVDAARAAQRERWRSQGWTRNAEASGAVLRRRPWRLPRTVSADLDRALDRGRLTLRGYDRVLRVAWSAADMRGADVPARDDVSLALLMRNQGAVAA